MIIVIAQTNPARGDLDHNIHDHTKFVLQAVAHQADAIIFPELSLTAYEPSMAKHLAVELHDNRLDMFQDLSNNHNIIIAAGAPVKQGRDVVIGMILFQPQQPRTMNSKHHLHADEQPFFVAGLNLNNLVWHGENVALAICYEISVPQHAADAAKARAGIYIASVAKTAPGVEKAHKRLSEIARTYSMTTLMANCVGMCEDGLCTGGSAAWDHSGRLLAQLEPENPGLLLFNTRTGEARIIG